MKQIDKIFHGVLGGAKIDDDFFAVITEENGVFYLLYNVPGELVKTEKHDTMGDAYESYRHLTEQHGDHVGMVSVHLRAKAAECRDD